MNEKNAKLDALMAQFNSADYLTQSRASAALARTKPRLSDLPALKKAFRSPYKGIACKSVLAVARIEPPDPKVIDALVAAATGRWESGCPQLFPEAIRALVKLAPDDRRVLEAIHKALSANNRGIRKDAIVALHKLASPSSLKTLRNLDKHLGKHPLCCDRLRELVATAISDISKKSDA